MKNSYSLVISPENVAKVAAWLATRKGVAVWKNCDLGSPAIGAETLTPATHENGEAATSPNWRNGIQPDRVVIDPAGVAVQSWREVARCKVRQGPPCYGFINRADRAKLDKALAKAGNGANWRPDYSGIKYGSAWFEAVIEIPGDEIPLASYLASVATE